MWRVSFGQKYPLLGWTGGWTEKLQRRVAGSTLRFAHTGFSDEDLVRKLELRPHQHLAQLYSFCYLLKRNRLLLCPMLGV